MKNTNTKTPVGVITGNSILSESAIARAKKATQSKEAAVAFLKSAGILNKSGKLAAPYR